MDKHVLVLMRAIYLAQRELAAYMEAGSRGEDVDPEMALAKLTAILRHAALMRATAALSGGTEGGAPLMPKRGEAVRPGGRRVRHAAPWPGISMPEGE